ncbi:MAG: hypothetical protein QNL04_05230 [SAR324 cluster bacterium]|nr:hypothetical protein [SAR324 cluster bacterium]
MRLVMKLGLLLLAFSLWGFAPLAAQEKIKEKKNKMGATYYNHSGGTYTLKEKSSGYNDSASDSMVGTTFFYERIFLSRFSIGVAYSSFLEKSLDMYVGTNTINVIEQTSYTAVDFKAFFREHARPGWKPFLGVGFGTHTVASAMTITADSATTTSTDATAASIPVTMLNWGFDYTMDATGIRMEMNQVTGTRRDLESSDTYSANYIVDGTSVGIAVYSHF